MRFLPDVNIWVAFSMPSHVHHTPVFEWAAAEPHLSLHFCRYTQQGLLRLITTSAVTSHFGHAAITNHAAVKWMTELLDDPRIHFAPEPNGVFEHWSSFADVRTASPKLWMDAYLAAFAVAGGYRLVTTDRAFKQFRGLNVLIL